MAKSDKPFASLTELRQRKAELRKEMQHTKDIIGESFSNFIDRKALSTALTTTLLVGAGAFLLRKVKKNEAIQALNMGLTTKAVGFAAWIPMIRIGLGYLLDFIEARTQTALKEEGKE